MENPNEIWQVDVNGEIYDANFSELSNWVLESSVLPTDKVRRGNLRWLEAGKVPGLQEFFNAKSEGSQVTNISVTSNEIDSNPIQNFENNKIGEIQGNQTFFTEEIIESNETGPELNSNLQTEFNSDENSTDICSIHKETPSFYICEVCSHYFCKACPNSYGAEVKTCPYCGGMCKRKTDFIEIKHQEIQFNQDISEGFGFNDFGKALAYPFNFKSSLFWGGLFFAIFSLGQGASGISSIFMMVAAIFCWMLANTLTFGVLANTLDNFAQGKTDLDFLPRFDDFDIWDDVVHPFLLSIAVWISSFGIMVVLILGAVWYSWNTFSRQFANPEQKVMNTLDQESVQSIDHVKQITEKLKKQNAGRPGLEVGEDGLTEAQRITIKEEAEFQRLSDLTKNYKKAQLESTLGKTPETVEKENQEFLANFVKVAGIFIILVGLAFFWGVLYFPAACIVAGYTRSFWSTLNPLIGLDTVKHLGVDYLKILVMTGIIWFFAAILGFVVSFVLSPFNLPMFGNLPARFIGSFISFFFAVVFSVTLGYAVYKNSSKLKLYR
jgi:hypothetical protein